VKVVINVRNIPQALKRGHILKDLTARVKLVPFPFSKDKRRVISDPLRNPMSRNSGETWGIPILWNETLKRPT